MKKIIPFLILIAAAIGASVIWAQETKTYYPNKQIKMEITDDGMKTYYENGTLMTDFPMKNGIATGVGKTYYPSGKLKREDDFLKMHWKTYSESGEVTGEGSSAPQSVGVVPAAKKKVIGQPPKKKGQ